jgi:hypothetical protein
VTITAAAALARSLFARALKRPRASAWLRWSAGASGSAARRSSAR